MLRIDTVFHCKQYFSSFFAGSLLNLTGILLPWTDFVLAKVPYQPNSRAQGESKLAAWISAAERLKDGFPQTSPFAAGPGIEQ